MGIQLSNVVPLYGKAAVDADEGSKFVFVQQVANGGKHMIFLLRGDDGGIVPEGLEIEDIVQPDLCLLMSFLYKDGVLSQAVFEEVGLLAEIKILTDTLDRFAEAVAGNGFDEESQVQRLRRHRRRSRGRR